MQSRGDYEQTFNENYFTAALLANFHFNFPALHFLFDIYIIYSLCYFLNCFSLMVHIPWTLTMMSETIKTDRFSSDLSRT